MCWRVKIGFIGAGKMGCSLGKYFSVRGLDVSGYYSLSRASARDAAAFTDSVAYGSMEALVSGCDALFLTVPDASVEAVWNGLKRFPLGGKHICHCSGAMPSSVFDGIEGLGAYGYSVHPLYAVHDRETAYRAMGGVYVTVECPARNPDAIERLFASLGNPVGRIGPERKGLYHAAAVTVSNLTTALAQTGAALFAECGLDGAFADGALRSLFLGNAENVCRSGIAESLTGPVERGDAETVQTHLALLSEPFRGVYAELSRVLLKVAVQKHPDRDFSELERILKR